MTKKVPKVYVDGDNYYEPYFGPITTITPTSIALPVFEKNSRTLQVSANPSELTDSEVVNYFTQSGPIEEVTIPFDKTKNKWKGFLYIVFESPAIVDELIKTPTKMIKGKKVLVAKKATSNNNNLNNAGLIEDHFSIANISSFSSPVPGNIATFSPTSPTTDSTQSLELSSYASIPLPTEFMIPIYASTTHSYAMPSASGYQGASSSAPAGISDIAGPSGLGGSQKK